MIPLISPLGAYTLCLLFSVALSGCSRLSGAEEKPVSAGTVETAAGFESVEVSTVGLDLRSQTPVVLLRQPESGQVVPIWVGFAEAQAIARSLHGIETPRPMTHDLLVNLVKELKAEINEVLVTEVRNGTYYGLIRFKVTGNENTQEIDSRPSDALAIALRVGAAIRVAPEILVDPPDFEFLAPEGPDQVVSIIGVTVVSPTDALRQKHGLPDRTGLVVTVASREVQERGLRTGDLIVKVNDVVPSEPIDFFQAVRSTPPGNMVRITFWREGQEHEVELPVAVPRQTPPSRPDSAIRI